MGRWRKRGSSARRARVSCASRRISTTIARRSIASRKFSENYCEVKLTIMLTMIVVLVAVVAMAGVWVWAQRAVAERDLAIIERGKTEARAIELQRRLDQA